jgi:DNA polymerase-4
VLAHIDLDAFYASVEELDNPALAGKPVIVGGLQGRGVVSACSYAARAFGVRSAMPLFMAKKLCPQGVFLPPRMARYCQLSRQVMGVIAAITPLLEQVSIDEAFLDLSGVCHLWGGTVDGAVQTLKNRIKSHTGLNCSVGAAPLRFLAKIASERCKPNGVLIVENIEEFIQTIELREISGIGGKTLVRLKELGLTRLAELQPLNPQFLHKRLGEHGLQLLRLAHGIDPRGINSEHEIKSISHERTFNHDIDDAELIRAALLYLSQKVARRLWADNLMARAVTLKIKFPDFRQQTFSRTLNAPTAAVMDIFHTAAAFLQTKWKLRLLGVGVAHLSPPRQAGLFQNQRLRSLQQAEDYLYKNYGDKGLTRASTLILNK